MTSSKGTAEVGRVAGLRFPQLVFDLVSFSQSRVEIRP